MTTMTAEANNGSRSALFIDYMYTVLMCLRQCIIYNYVKP